MREVVSVSELQPGDVIGITEDDLPAAVVYRVSSVSGEAWAVDATATNTYEKLEMRAWGSDLVTRYS